MSHHLDTQEALNDRRLDLGDVYVFEGTGRQGPGHRGADFQNTVLILTTNPFAGASDSEAGTPQPAAFHPDAVYEFKIDVNGDFVEDISYRIHFGPPDESGEQRVELRRAEGAQARAGRDGQVIALGITGAAAAIAGGGRMWAGLSADPFFSNGAGFERFGRRLLSQ